MQLSAAMLTVLLLPKLRDTGNAHGCQTVLSNVSSCSIWTNAGSTEKVGKKKGALLVNANKAAAGQLVQCKLAFFPWRYV
jgi:hypothetical protein